MARPHGAKHRGPHARAATSENTRVSTPINDHDLERTVRGFGFTAREFRTLCALRHPAGVQRALDAMPYHLAETAWSPRRVLAERTAHCLEGAIFAAAALRVLGFPPLLLDLEAVQDTDHVIAVYRADGHWGAIAKSNFSGLRCRAPVYRTLRELAMSYFEDYINLRGERTLRASSAPSTWRASTASIPDG